MKVNVKFVSVYELLVLFVNIVLLLCYGKDKDF